MQTFIDLLNFLAAFFGAAIRSLWKVSLVTGLVSCTAREKNLDGFAVYSDIRFKPNLTFALENEGLSDRVKNLLPLTLDTWNGALGSNNLRQVQHPLDADIVIRPEITQDVSPEPGHVELLGCFVGYQSWTECRIHLKIPQKIQTPEQMQNLSHLLRQGPLDHILHTKKEYSEISDYLLDKLVVLSLAHEIGHTLGLAHTKDPRCLMNSSPRGELGFCPAEIRAARQLLSIE